MHAPSRSDAGRFPRDDVPELCASAGSSASSSSSSASCIGGDLTSTGSGTGEASAASTISSSRTARMGTGRLSQTPYSLGTPRAAAASSAIAAARRCAVQRSPARVRRRQHLRSVCAFCGKAAQRRPWAMLSRRPLRRCFLHPPGDASADPVWRHSCAHWKPTGIMLCPPQAFQKLRPTPRAWVSALPPRAVALAAPLEGA
jgi:hypothetical protein